MRRTAWALASTAELLGALSREGASRSARSRVIGMTDGSEQAEREAPVSPPPPPPPPPREPDRAAKEARPDVTKRDRDT